MLNNEDLFIIVHLLETYEAEIVKRGIASITVQPLVADEAFMTHMEAMFVPFHMEYGSLICY